MAENGPERNHGKRERVNLPSGCLYVPLWQWLVLVIVIAVGWAAWKGLPDLTCTYWSGGCSANSGQAGDGESVK